MNNKDISVFSDELVRLIPYLIRGMLRKQTNLLSNGALTVPQYLTLGLINTYTSLKMKQVAKELNISLPAATGMVERLYQVGLIKREHSTLDRRVIRITLTPKGVRTLDSLRKKRKKAIEEVFSGLSAGERDSYLKILRKVKAILYENK